MDGGMDWRNGGVELYKQQKREGDGWVIESLKMHPFPLK